ncbi:MAG: hypothetical protein R3311_20450, partial [Oceanisphaera sp.]|nr:hypothetical protein [Oceanisphaera sp.]
VKPHEEAEAYVDAMLGNYGQQRLKAGFNQPVTDRFFARAALNITKDDGYFKNIGQGRNNPTNDRQALLFQTRWEPGDDFTLDSQLFYGKIRENFPGINCNVPSDDALFIRGLWVAHPGDTDPSNPQALRANCERNSRQQLGDLTADQGPNAQLDKDLDTVLLGATAEWQFTEHHALKLVAGARGEKEGPIQASDSDGGPEQWGNNINTEDSDRTSFSLELQLNGDFLDQRLRYTTGVFVMRETNTENFTTSSVLKGIDIQTLGDLVAGELPSQPVAPSVPMVGILGGPTVVSDFDLENTTAAIFAQVSYDLTQNLELTLGARWTSEERISELTVTQADFDATRRPQRSDQGTQAG